MDYLTCEKIEKLFKNIFVGNETGCWNWTKARTNGYGRLGIEKNRIIYQWRAHRLSYHLFFGEIHTGLLVCHKCDNPSCVNPYHLFIGSDKDNCIDARTKGRRIATKHGNPGMYKNGCRCFKCKEGKRIYYLKNKIKS